MKNKEQIAMDVVMFENIRDCNKYIDDVDEEYMISRSLHYQFWQQWGILHAVFDVL